jgi:hypothetical protein
MRLFELPWRVLRAVLLVLVALIMFIEEFGWEPLTAWVGRLATWPPLARLEAAIRRLPPRVALALFLVPALLLFPIKIAALALIQAGHAASGLTVIVVAKVAGTALVGRLFILLEPQLLQFAWFVRALEWWRATKQRVRDALRASALWRRIRVTYRSWRMWLFRVMR